MKMENAIDHEKHEKMQKAAIMVRVPLLDLDRLIKERRAHALEGIADSVDVFNKMIAELLAL